MTGPFQIEAQTTYGSDAEDTGSDSIVVALPSATLQAPADRAEGPQFNPIFRWQGGPNEVFAVVLGSVSANGRVREIEQLQANGVGDLSSSSRAKRSGLVEKNLYPLPGTATFNVSASGSGTARLDQPLQPGDYSWRVISAGPAANPKSHVSSPTHYFTVLGPQLRRLRATTTKHPQNTFQYPGYTLLHISSTPYAELDVTYREGHFRHDVTQYLGDNTRATLRFNWSCQHPATLVRYTVHAFDDEGNHKTVRGTAPAISRARCSALHQAQLATQRAADLAARRAAQRAQEQARQEQQQQYENFAHNCEALGGSPTVLWVGGGEETVCRAPWGGYLYVPA